MEMAGIVCYTGAHIIMKAREIIEQIGRPLELDTDGIWCVLPASFPENFQLSIVAAGADKHEQKNTKTKTITISYPNAILNEMVKEYFTNDQYHDLVNAQKLEYKIHDENSIFFEVDGPYLAMVLPASKEEGKKLKKRYAVFNFDGSLAELKGFEVKRRGELQLIKIFQSSVFDAFLKGDTLETCYASVAKVADYWLDVLFSQGKNMPDAELFELISENRSMSKKLEEYGAQKSTSISTAKRLAEFLGDQMIKDKGLACKFIISKKPDGAPVTDRAIPLAIFQSEESIQRHYLRKWLKDNSISSFDIRDILDWDYYIERLGGTIQKIITIPAAMQGLANPVPRVKHPDWLYKKVMEKADLFKQRKITDMFNIDQHQQQQQQHQHQHQQLETDIEDIAIVDEVSTPSMPTLVRYKRKRLPSNSEDKENEGEAELRKSWKEVLGPPPPLGETRQEICAWISFQKKKWAWQAKQRTLTTKQLKRAKQNNTNVNSGGGGGGGVVRSGNAVTLGGFLKRAQRSLLDSPWQIIQIASTNAPGEFKLWCLVGNELHNVKLIVPRIFYVNLRKPKEQESGVLWRKCNRILPRAKPSYFLYKYSVPETLYIEHGNKMYMDLSDPSVEGVYETQLSLMFRAILDVGCICTVNRETLQKDKDQQNDNNTFSLEQLRFQTVARQPYLSNESSSNIRHIYMYHHKAPTGAREMYGLFLNPLNKALIIVVDSVRTNLMPNMHNLYVAERQVKMEQNASASEALMPAAEVAFDVRVETDLKQVYRVIQRALQQYRDEKKGATYIAIQTNVASLSSLQANMPELSDFPQVQIHVQDVETLYNTLEWQRNGAKVMVRHYLNSGKVLQLMVEQSRYFHVPLGNIPADPTLFGADLFYARHLHKNNFVLWCSGTDKPDLGGSEKNDARLIAEFQEDSSEICNEAGAYSTVCVELDIDSLAINTLLQSHHVNDIEGTSSGVAFDQTPQTSTIDKMMASESGAVASDSDAHVPYDDTAMCSEAFKVLKYMVNEWLRDISIYRNRFADFQIVHFYRWLRSSKALLFEPAILRTLQNLMKKLFIQLVAEFKRLGSIIIFANFNKIVVCTKKNRIADAIGYVEFVVKSIRNKELFHSIEITYNQCWAYLLWLDLANHGGVQGKLPAGLSGVGESQSEISQQEESSTQSDSDSSIIIMNWNLMDYLPEECGCRKSFKMAIAGYISAVYSFIHKENAQNGDIVQARINASQSQSAVLGVGTNINATEFAQKLISEEMSQKLFEITERISMKVASTPRMKNAALEFVKTICHVLALDPAVEDVVYTLKQNMLRLINISEFSEEAVWKDPSVSYILPGFICKACNHCRDIDLGRDNHQNVQQNTRSWYCPLCKNDYENGEIEHLLLETVNRKLIAYNLQDLQCQKCAQVKMENLTSYCTCAGDFNCLISNNDLTKLIKIFYKIALDFNMNVLKETIDYIFMYS